ncbi:MAG: hypothetical protein P8X42_04580 [Calditrichaceae bacterium]
MKSLTVKTLFLTFLLCLILNAQPDIWVPTNGPESGSVTKFSRNPLGQIFTATTSGYLYRSENGGLSWDILYSPTSPKSFESIFTPVAATIYAGVSGQGIFKSIDGGGSWDNLAGALQTMNVTAIDTNQLGHLLAGTSSNGIYRSENGGDSWIQINDGISLGSYPRVEDFAMSPSGELYASISNSGIYRSFDNGDNWTEISSALPNKKFHDIVHTPNANLLSAVDGEGIRFSSDDGATWSLKNTGLDNISVLVLKLAPNGDLICGCRGGDVYQSVNEGDSWIKIDDDITPQTIQDIAAFGSKILIGTIGEGMYLKPDQASLWAEANNGFNNAQINDVEIDTTSRLFAATNNMIYVSDDDGERWTQKRNGIPSTQVTDISINKNNNYIFAATSWGVCRSEDGGENWTLLNNGLAEDSYTAIKVNNKNSIIFVARDSIRVYRSANQGDSWSEVSNGLIQSASYGIIKDIAIDNDGYIYAATNDYNNPKGIFRSVNNGDYWSQANTGLGNLLVNCLGVSADGVLFAGTQGGGIYRSRDNGSNWENVMNYTYIQSITFNSAGHIFAGTSNGIYRSTDGGDTWQSFSRGMTDKYTYSLITGNNDQLFAGTLSTSVIKTTGSTTLPSPHLSFPADQAATIPVNLTFDWQEVPAAIEYEIQVSEYPDFSTIAFEKAGIANNSVEVNDLVYYRTYYWRVRSWSGYAVSSWSGTWSFTTQREGPDLYSPNDNSSNMPTEINFSWSSVAGALNYELQISFDAEFTTTEITKNNINGTNILIDSLETDNIYYWRVRAITDDGISGWSVVYRFTTSKPGPGPIFPGYDEINVPSDVKFTWNSVMGAESYEFQVTTDYQFLTIDQSYGPVTDTTYLVDGLYHNQDYYWRVRANFSDGSSGWSDPCRFTTMREGPTLVSPYNGSNGLDPSVTISWNNISEAVNYHFQVSSDPEFGSPEFDYDQIYSTYYDLGDVGNSNEFYWRVRANFADGVSDWSTVWNFRTRLGPVTLDSPADYATDLDFPITLSWQSESVASYYLVQVSLDEGFSDVVIDTGYIYNTYCDIRRLDLNTQYFWRVAGVDNEAVGEWSDTRRFTTASYPSTIHAETSINFPYHENPGDFDASDYRLFGMPGNSDIYLDQIFGGGHEEQWIAYCDDYDFGNSRNVFVKYTPDDGRFRCYQGLGFWVINKGQLDINMDLNSAWLNDSNQAPIGIQNGWNIITSPFPFPVSWDVVRQLNGLGSLPLYAYDSGFYTTDALQPYQGYYIDNSSNMSEILIPYNTSMAKTANKEALIWKIQITMKSGNYSDAATWLGVAENAEKTFDQFDYRKPQSFGDVPKVYFDRSEWGGKWNSLASDIRPNIQDLESWDFEVNAPAGQNTMISFTGISQVPEKFNVFLIDNSIQVR